MGRVSLDPDKQVKGGGKWDDIDIEIISHKATTWDYMGSQPAGPAIEIVARTGANEEPMRPQYLSAGKPDKLSASPDGSGFDFPDGAPAFLQDSCNAAHYLTSLKNCGQDMTKFLEDLTKVGSIFCHVKQVTRPKGGGLDKDTSYMVVSKIYDKPLWTPAVSGVVLHQGQTGATQSAAPAAGNGQDYSDEAEMFISQAIQDAPEPLNQVQLNRAVFALLKDDDPIKRGKITGLTTTGWLKDPKRPWIVEKGKVLLK